MESARQGKAHQMEEGSNKARQEANKIQVREKVHKTRVIHLQTKVLG